MQITIIIPTKNRSIFVKHQLDYYKFFNFKGRILFLDSSSINIFKLNQDLINQFKNINVTIHHIVGSSFDTFKVALPFIKTKYVLFSGDDDFYIVSSLVSMIKFMDKSKNYIGVTAKGIQIETEGKFNEKIRSFNFYNINEYSQNTSSDRLKEITSNYSTVLFSVLRTNIFKKIVRLTPFSKNMHLIFQSELLPCFLTVIFGKLKKINILFLYRFVGHPRVKHQQIDQLFHDSFFNHSYKESIKIILKKINGKISKKKKNYLVKQYFYNYFYFAKKIQSKKFLLKKFIYFFPDLAKKILTKPLYYQIKEIFIKNNPKLLVNGCPLYKKSYLFLFENIQKNKK